MDITIKELQLRDIRFPTSSHLDGSDAMNPDPDYSAAYVILKTDDNRLEGHGLTFTIGRGNDICLSAAQELSRYVVNRRLTSVVKNMGQFWRELTSDSQLRWLGPEKGVIHLATAAIINAVWDLFAKVQGKPLWKLLVDMSPNEIISLIDFRYINDVLSADEAFDILEKNEKSKEKREAKIVKNGYPAYNTSIGWLGYSDEKIRRLCRRRINEGWSRFKLKVGLNINDDIRRLKIIREEIGKKRILMLDANQVWEVEEAITNIKKLAQFNPFWIEEPTNPDDILGHLRISSEIRPIRVATGEHCHNRVMFKQFLQANAIQVCQIDTCRLGGVNEALAVIFMAAKYNIPVCPHAGGVGLCEYVQHLSIFDYIYVSASLENRMIEYVDHLHEHFENPVEIIEGRYIPPKDPGFSITMKTRSIKTYEYPNGSAWLKRLKLRP